MLPSILHMPFATSRLVAKGVCATLTVKGLGLQPSRAASVTCLRSVLHKRHRAALSNTYRSLCRERPEGIFRASSATAKRHSTTRTSAGGMETAFVPAIVTPFKPGSLEVDVESLKSYLKYLWDAGIRDIVVNGSTGEFPSMSLAERQLVAEVAREAWPGRQFVGISTCNVPDSLQLLNHAQQPREHLKGSRCIADGVLVLPPYYFASAVTTQHSLEAFLSALIKESSIPVYLYNFPANTNNLISAEVYGRLAQQFPQLRGIKNTFDDIQLSKKFKAAAPDRQVYAGHDPSALAALEAGLDGCIVATGNVTPAAFLAIEQAFKAGNTAATKEHLDIINAWNDTAERCGVNPFSAVKAGLAKLVPGFPVTTRPPLQEASSDQKQELQKLL